MVFGSLGGVGKVGCLGVLFALVFPSRTFCVGAYVGVRVMRGELCVFQTFLFEFQSVWAVVDFGKGSHLHMTVASRRIH